MNGTGSTLLLVCVAALIFFVMRWFRHHGGRYLLEDERQTLTEQIDGDFWGVMVSTVMIFICVFVVFQR